MKVTYLGTASCFPTPKRNVSCTALQLSDGQVWLFDSGECTQVQIQKSNLKLGKVEKVFITHLHGDHLYGLPGLLLTLGNGLDPELASKKVVDIYGPIGLRKYLITSLEIARSAPNFRFNIHELVPESDQYPQDWNEWKVEHQYDYDTGLNTETFKVYKMQNDKGHRFWPIFQNSKFNIKAIAIKHRIPCFGYVIEEQDQAGTFNVEKAKELGIPPGPLYGKLKSGENIFINNQEIKPEQVLGDPIKGRKIVILGDTCDTSEMIPFCQNADYVIHEATMENSLREKAIEYGHSTPEMAAEFSVKINARKLVLFHVSPRYKPIEDDDNENAESAKVLLLEAENYLSKNQANHIKVLVAEDFLEDTIERKK